MPEIKPFRGYLYDTQKVDIAKVIAPPYDVITPEQQSGFYKLDDHNIIRLILNNDADPYSSAGRVLDAWKKEGVLRQDDSPFLYVVSQAFTLPGGKKVVRTGFVAACKIEEFGKGSVYPHEKTHSGPKEDRFKLFQATGTMYSQIFGLYNDSAGTLNRYLSAITKLQPAIDLTFEGVRNSLWKMEDGPAASAISEFIHSQKVFIADGHHRYETALAYRDSCRLRNPNHTGREAYNFVPMFLTNMQDPGLVILPTHRLVHSLPDFNPGRLLEQLSHYFEIDSFNNTQDMLQKLPSWGSNAYGMLLAGEDGCRILQAKRNKTARGQSPAEKMIDELDVTILHSIVFEKLLGISPKDQEKKVYLEYVKDAQQAIETVRDKKAQAAFIMNPTTIDQVRTISLAGKVMPQKSTFFYPKLLSGLVNYSFQG
ncbi:MAG TPA: DUF1015 domain-containing protein [Bacteroidota bacterium]|jgi:uncharacterized protein (DUF1015 family)|nr:DUF1015 domain-containing protein [Bacteroidota bacterium]